MRIASSTRLLSIILLLIYALSGTAAAPQQNEIEKRIDALLAKMTLEEKLGQLQQLDGEAEGNYRPEHVELVRKGLLGSTLNVRGAKRSNELQRVAIEQSRLKIPLIFGFDVIHGYRTIFPVPLGEASSWDPAAVERAASVAAAESRASGVHWTFAPMVDIARDARWGRIVEGSGEDPYLGSAMARARVRGFQGTDYSKPDKIVSCAKHWVAYGAAEGGRDYNTTDMSERVLREIYFPPFKAAVDAGVGTLMSAFNDLNGSPTSANPFTLSQVLREEWKFDGFVVTDYTAVLELMNHRLAATEAEAAQRALNAGADMEMVSRLYSKHIGSLLREGKVTQRTIDNAVRRILRIKFRLGLFEKPYADEALERTVILNAANVTAAREVAARSLVLLKNERNTLPLNKNVKSIAVIGPLADDPKAMLGSWAGDGKAANTVTLLGGIKEKVSGARILYAKGVAIEGRGVTGNYDASVATETAGGTNVASAANVEAARNAITPAGPNSIDEAVRVAREADVSVIAIGETAEMSGEAASRTSLDLPGKQMDLIRAIHGVGKPYVVVLMNGRPLTINWLAENSPAILETWFAGTQAGPAIADVLFGDINPGGKLPVTFPRTIGQVPMYYNHKSTGRPPTDQKYTSKYLDVPVTPLYPFGYGLSYTQFKFGPPQLSASSITPDGQLTVTVEVENVGSRAGDEVVQLYIRDQASSVTRAIKELKGFERITLRPGEKRRVQFVLKPEHLGFYNRDMRFVVEPGEFKVMVGPNSEELLETSFEVVAR
ncbi:MAG: beta-glucosidase BglX [Acidobacteria bacterium]|nr:MAG: beta-glucosidase BglX [Acidobacteriota bacterium]